VQSGPVRTEKCSRVARRLPQAGEGSWDHSGPASIRSLTRGETRHRRENPMSIAQTVSTHDHEVANDVLSHVRRIYPDLDAQDAFPAPTWYYKQTCWMEDKVDSENALYNLPIAVRITGALDVTLLRKCLREVQLRHDVLRSVFREVN